MYGSLAIVLAVLGIAMFSGTIWMQREWLPRAREAQPGQGMQAVSIDDGYEGEENAARSGPDESWVVGHVLMK